ncbi:MAG TPA: hypothetical protein GX695_00270 [Acholeplasmataceae bacterium]|nr:hypothetical protein [Acholeplasmataceae bacterium]
MHYYVFVKNYQIDENIHLNLHETINRFFGKVTDTVVKNDNLIIVVKNHFHKENINEYLKNYIYENLLNVEIYVSKDFNDLNQLVNEFELIESLFTVKSFNSKTNVYDLKTLLFEKLIFNIDISIKKHILKSLYNNVEYYSTLKAFFENNLNILKTSRMINVHRNTLIYRLDRFLSITMLDPRNFNDAFLIKLLIDY